LAKWAIEHLFELPPQDATPYVLLSNNDVVADMWYDAEKVRNMMKDENVNRVLMELDRDQKQSSYFGRR
jgi:hypothetical protein